jgi:NAD-dependent deacetylase
MTESTLAEKIARVRELVQAASNILVITGAGVSAESGIPTFRTRDGLWAKYNPMEYATPEAFEQDPVKVWKWYDLRRQTAAEARPNPAHRALAQLEQSGKRVFVVTQNVDDLHEQAGSREVVHLHGSIWRLRCERDGNVVENREVPLSELPPTCFCGNVLRPDIVWFGEPLPRPPLQEVEHYFFSGPIQLGLTIGTEASFGYVIEFAVRAQEHGATLVDINPRVTDLSKLADVHLMGKAGEILPRLIRADQDATADQEKKPPTNTD